MELLDSYCNNGNNINEKYEIVLLSLIKSYEVEHKTINSTQILINAVKMCLFLSSAFVLLSVVINNNVVPNLSRCVKAMTFAVVLTDS